MIDIRRHNANFCAPHFLHHCEEQVAKTIDDFDDDHSRTTECSSRCRAARTRSALWDLLLDARLPTPTASTSGSASRDYSDESGEHARAFAEDRSATLLEVDLPDDYGFDMPNGAKAARRVPCSACGLSKRHLFDKAALDGGYDVVATGHNLDDEAAVLFGNVLRWNTDYLGAATTRCSPARPGFPTKVKPLVRLGEREMAAYCVLRGIDYRSRSARWPTATGTSDTRRRSTRSRCSRRARSTTFYFGFLDKVAARVRRGSRSSRRKGCGALRALRRAVSRRDLQLLPLGRAGGEGPGREGSTSSARRAGAARSTQGAALPRDPQDRERVPLPRGLHRPRRAHRPGRGHDGARPRKAWPTRSCGRPWPTSC